MRRVVVAAFLLTGCASGSQTVAPPSPSPAPSPVATPSDHALMRITDECVGLASVPDCANARIACAKAVEMFDAAKLPGDDKQRGAVSGAAARCAPAP